MSLPARSLTLSMVGTAKMKKSSSDEKRRGKINTARVTSVAKAAATVEKQ